MLNGTMRKLFRQNSGYVLKKENTILLSKVQMNGTLLQIILLCTN